MVASEKENFGRDSSSLCLIFYLSHEDNAMKFVRPMAIMAMIPMVVAIISPCTTHAQATDQATGSSSVTRSTIDTFVPNVLPSLTIPKNSIPFQIDGDLSDPGWEYAAVAGNFSENFPDEQAKPPIGISVRVAYDDANMYIAYDIVDDPASIRANYSDRDRIWQDDYVGILLDTNGDGQQVYFMAANPFGIQGDTFSSGREEDMSFDLIFESAGRITETGYQVEMAIPFRSLRFPAAEMQNWRATFWITHPRDSRNQYTWAARDSGDPCSTCQLGYLTGLEGVQSGKNLEILPSVTGFQSASLEDFDNADSPFNTEQFTAEPSLGIKYGITSDLTVDATINPDFSQIESDAAQIDVNSTFALFNEEQRPFFQEGSDLFDTKFRAVYTRTINNPIAATKLTGRVGRTSIGYIGARDEDSPILLPFEESSTVIQGGKSFSNIFRARYGLGNSSFLGAMLTDRRMDGGGSGTLLSLDGSVRILTSYTFSFQAALSQTHEAVDSTLSSGLGDMTFDDGRYTAAFDGESFSGNALSTSLGRGGRHWNFDVTYSANSPAFRADNGFIRSNDNQRIMTFQSYTFYPSLGFIDRITPRFMGMRRWDYSGVNKQDWAGGAMEFQLKAQTSFNVQYNWSRENFDGIQYDNMTGVRTQLRSNFSEWMGVNFEYRWGDAIARNAAVPYIGNSRNINAGLTLKLTRRLVLQPNLSFSDLKHPETGATEFSGYIGRARVNYQFTGKLLARVIVQYNDFAESLDVDPLITYRVSPFTVFHVGSTHTYLTFPGAVGEQQFFAQSSRQIFFKFQYLLQR